MSYANAASFLLTTTVRGARRHSLEALESRIAPAYVGVFSGASGSYKLTLSGDNAGHAVSVSAEAGGKLAVKDLVTADEQLFNLEGVTQIALVGGSGAVDTVYLSANTATAGRSVVFDGGAAGDNLTVLGGGNEGTLNLTATGAGTVNVEGAGSIAYAQVPSGVKLDQFKAVKINAPAGSNDYELAGALLQTAAGLKQVQFGTISEVTVNLGAGDTAAVADTLTLTQPVPTALGKVIVDLGDGDDVITLKAGLAPLGNNGALFLLGGAGTDTVKVATPYQGLEFASVAGTLWQNLERLDLTDPVGSYTTLNISGSSVLNLGGLNKTLVVRNDEGDVVNVGAEWQYQRREVTAEATYTVFTAGEATLKVENAQPFYYVADGIFTKTSETESSVIFTVVRGGIASGTGTVEFITRDGTGVSGKDYVATWGTVNFGAGETSKQVTVPVLDDHLAGLTKTMFLNLTRATGGTLYDAQGQGNILDDDTSLKIAPNGRSATYVDVDGDLVTVKLSSGTLRADRFILAPVGNAVGGEQLQWLDLRGYLPGTGVTITAMKTQAGGDGVVNVGAIEGMGMALGTITVGGDLGQIDATAVKTLAVGSLGGKGLATQAAYLAPTLESTVTGKLGTLAVQGDVLGATVNAGSIGAVLIKGSLVGSATKASGLHAATTLGAVNIGGDVLGAGALSVQITAGGLAAPKTTAQALAIKSLTVGGQVKQAEVLAGYNAAGALTNADVQVGTVSVKGDWTGASLLAGVSRTGVVFGDGGKVKIASRIASIVIGGQVAGTAVAGDGFLFSAQQVGAVKIGNLKVLVTKRGDDLPLGGADDVRLRDTL